MDSGAGDTTRLVPGSPIRTPWDHSSVDSSPRPIAASHVLHRLLVPRHPPFALSNLTTKMLASTVQFSTNNHPHHPAGTHPHQGAVYRPGMDDPPEHTPTPNRGRACSFRTQQGANTTTSHHPHPVPHPPPHGGGRYYACRSPPAPAHQCLRRLSRPHPHIRGARAVLPGLTPGGAP
jgi:hypothetical protein